ncbi:hypothetical protein PCA20602_02715 [Pandoraea capi]|uniref:DUF3310 domain-containing protein n=1 Tax=Pandoraea capi TaxID=2508286 RepID=A0ABY6W0U2_9BURK|nr:DUF3310 domain-containing protein [Pandoraea capi]VVE12635.1 hypothetical protein PCA20602_02715 [Pandoraea capi]
MSGGYRPTGRTTSSPPGSAQPAGDAVNSPAHYTKHPSGVECIAITEHMGFNLGNAIKYIWRADLKNDAIEDLKKAEWYIRREIQKRERQA